MDASIINTFHSLLFFGLIVSRRKNGVVKSLSLFFGFLVFWFISSFWVLEDFEKSFFVPEGFCQRMMSE